MKTIGGLKFLKSKNSLTTSIQVPIQNSFWPFMKKKQTNKKTKKNKEKKTKTKKLKASPRDGTKVPVATY